MSTPSTPGAEPSPRQAGGESEKSRYRSTLNLPKTAFAMKANLVQNEPLSIRRWSEMDLYGAVRRARAGREKFVFHDGPPYANGSIHLGHFLNKSLKDVVVRSRTMMGMDCPFVPGWDCHGLPIEHRVMQEMLEKGKLAKVQGLPEDQRRMVVRRECQAYAEKYVKLHVEQMTRALTLADYSHPYLTMQPSFEGATLEVLAALVEQGLVYRALKPVHWSIANETALAEAELEYEDRVDLSVYVDFEAADADAVYDAFGLPPHTSEEDEDEEADDAEAGRESVRLPKAGVRPNVRPSFMIWTTTPWTLPANLAIAANARFEYALVYVDGNITVMASALVEKVTALAKAEHVRVLATTTGDRLVGLGYRHPFVDHGRGEGMAGPAVFTLAEAEYVTLEDGTGLVHTAPGHGTEDFQTGARVGLPVYCPVRGNGTYDQTVPEWLRGMEIWKANEAIVSRLEASGHLFHSHRFTHSYPHDWRSKTPVIFRCTEQWFVGVDTPMARDGTTLRAAALGAIDASRPDAVRFVPEWGRNRMRGMLESRPDWCISRQRAWGLPIPAFFWRDAQGREHALLTPASVRAVARLVREKGADVWFQSTPETLLSGWDPAADRDLPAWWTSHGLSKGVLGELRKGPDILDVWFESGSTWNAAMRERSGGADFPVELYLEGADQHRGWFQSSLLPSLGMMGRAPYRALLTHGFTVDKDGRKLSKSSGDTIEELYASFGADVLRWWVTSQSYENDMKVDRSFFELAGESYRKVRNTLRFMLSNLADAPRDSAPSAEPVSIDAWVLAEYERVAAGVVSAYREYDFAAAQRALYDFCNDTLSAVYLAAIKDRLYCDRAESPRRRRTQATLRALTDGLCRLLAPILPHTADEAYRELMGVDAKDRTVSVHLREFVMGFGTRVDPAWAAVMSARSVGLAAMERARKEIGVDNPLDMGVTLPDPRGELARFDPVDLADLLGVSRVTLQASATQPAVIDLRDQPRCERSWKRDGTVRTRSDGGMLSDRDAAAIGLA